MWDSIGSDYRLQATSSITTTCQQSGISPISVCLNRGVPPRQAPREQLLHQAALDDLNLVDDRLSLLDGVVHRGEDGGNLVLLGKWGEVELQS